MIGTRRSAIQRIQNKMHTKSWEFWIDVGGTFTDCIAKCPNGSILTDKLLSSSHFKGSGITGNTSRSFNVKSSPSALLKDLNGQNVRISPISDTFAKPLQSTIVSSDLSSGQIKISNPINLPEGSDISFEIFFKEPAPVLGIHQIMGLGLNERIGAISLKLGTTRGTNALLERNGARTALIINKGFADLPKIAFQDRPHLFDLHIRKPEPLFEKVVEVSGRVASDGTILQELDPTDLRRDLQKLKDQGIESLAISLIHSHIDSSMELAISEIAQEMGFRHISMSHQMSGVPGWIVRTDTTLVDAYLSPILSKYVQEIQSLLPEASIQMMASSGSLFDASDFSGKDSILSGPAGGVVGAVNAAANSGFNQLIGFDMGGTSTDVCRYSGDLERRHSMEVEDKASGGSIRIAAPMLSVETVAAGGGSICWFDGQMPRVGPRSAGAHPGPACYGNDGPLSITDINVFLGRVVSDQFPFPLDHKAVINRLDELINEIKTQTGRTYSRQELAEGFARIANANMAAPIRQISVSKGYDVRDYAMVSFGGAGSQHACFVAEELGISTIICSPFGGILSALGIGTADVSRFTETSLNELLADRTNSELTPLFLPLIEELKQEFSEDIRKTDALNYRRFLELRYKGQESTLPIELTEDSSIEEAFTTAHQTLYGFQFPDRPIEIFAIRAQAAWQHSSDEPIEFPQDAVSASPLRVQKAIFRDKEIDTSVAQAASLQQDAPLHGPAILTEPIATIVLPPNWKATRDTSGNIILNRLNESNAKSPTIMDYATPDPIELELFNNRFASIADQMGETLKRTSLSTNVKERLDFSCALFDPSGGLVVNAPHIPVHLGAMSQAVCCLMEDVPELRPGEIYVTNDPYRGGSHLPDVTVITPVFTQGESTSPDFFVASRAHHSEIGGITPGSMPPFSDSLAEEGVVIRAFRLTDGKQVFDQELKSLLSNGPYPSRSVDENIADIHAQAAANQAGVKALQDWIDEQGLAKTQAYMGHIQKAAEKKMRQALTTFPEGIRRFEDMLDDGSPLCVSIDIQHENDPSKAKAHIDFSGTGPVLKTNQNANPAIVSSAAIYCLRCLIPDDIPLNGGVLAPVTIHVPENTFLNPTPDTDPTKCPPVAGGNVETSQRIVDVLLGALGVTAASQGTMNNLLFGRQPSNERSGFGYYETIGGGSGAGPDFTGADAVHTHMTNTRLTDPEILEQRYPVRLKQWSIRHESGGKGLHKGGNGMIREFEFLEPLDLSLVTSRRTSAPYGLNGGGPGSPGKNLIQRNNTEDYEPLPHACQILVQQGDRIRIETPGGGGSGITETSDN